MNIKDVLIRISEIPTKIQIQGWETKLSHIGNLDNLITDAKTNLVDAINEIKESSIGPSDAMEVIYDDSSTKLGATNVQDAIVALNNKYKTIEALANKLDAEVNGQVSSLNLINSEAETTIGIPLTTKEKNKKSIIKQLSESNDISIEELKAIKINASDITYEDHATSLGVTDVQKAIEALANKFIELENKVNATNNTVTAETANLKAINAELQREIGVMVTKLSSL